MADDYPPPVFLTTDTEELRTDGNAWLDDSDLVTAARHHVLLPSASQYGSDVLAAAARRFEDRMSYALEALAGEVEQVGHNLRGTAQSYDYMDTSAADGFTTLTQRLDDPS